VVLQDTQEAILAPFFFLFLDDDDDDDDDVGREHLTVAPVWTGHCGHVPWQMCPSCPA